MLRQTIDYGIDLGTTNSSIARVDKGKITVFKIEPHKKTIMPSCIHFTKRGQMYVGDLAYSKLFIPNEKNTFAEFKRKIGSDDTDFSSHMGRHYSPEELSAEVLKKLKISVKDDDFSSVVITVPAAFNQVQIEATRRAAEMAGFEYFELLQEPIAASLGYLGDKKNIEGIWLVFDLGGGTFDAALMKMEGGIITVVDHAGDNYLGGKNMDWLIVDEIIIPQVEKEFSIQAIMQDDSRLMELRRAWKPLAETAKIAMSEEVTYIIEPDVPVYFDTEGKGIDIAIKVDRSEFENLISPLIDRTISICRELLERNNLSPSELLTILMVGGPTYIPLLRERVKSELNVNINVSVDPMTIVAQGAALFASTRPIPIVKQKRNYSKVQLTLGYPQTTIEKEVKFAIRIDRERFSGTIPDRVFAEIVREDMSWTSGKIELENNVGLIQLHLIENSVNNFSIELSDNSGNKLECEPNYFSILQGIKISQPPLPHDVGISAIAREFYNKEIMVPIINKGTSLPAVGKGTFTVAKNLRPGNSSDFVKIIVWEGKGKTYPMRNVWVGELVISGDKLSSLLPEGSKVEVTIRMDESRRANVSAYIPYLDESIEKVMDLNKPSSTISAEELTIQINKDQRRINDLLEKMHDMDLFNLRAIKSIKSNLDELDTLIVKGRGDSDRIREVQNRLNELAIKLDEFEGIIKGSQIEKEFDYELDSCKQVVERFGGKTDEQYLSRLIAESQKPEVQKNINRLNDILDKLRELKWKILFSRPEYWVSVLNAINESFEEIQWSDKSKAFSLIDRGGEILASGQFTDEIKRIVLDLWELMPEPDKEKTKKPRTDILHY